MMTDSMLPLAIFIFIVTIFPVLLILGAKLLTPANPNPVKCSTYECGEIPVGEGRVRFVIQYYAYAIIFTIFDVAVLLLLISATQFAVLGIGGLMPILIFIGVVTLSLIHAWQLLRRKLGE